MIILNASIQALQWAVRAAPTDRIKQLALPVFKKPSFPAHE